MPALQGFAAAKTRRLLTGFGPGLQSTFVTANMVERPTEIFRAMADPTRLRILHILRKGELCVGDLVTVLGIPQPSASRHLTLLRKAGLITARKNSYWTFYTLAPARSPLRAKVLELLEVDTNGTSRDEKRLAALRRHGGCCPS
jgi:ArsR family transcriptional regulator